MLELLALVGLLVALVFSQDEHPEKAIMSKVKSLGFGYLKFLIKFAFLALLLPVVLLVCGAAFDAPTCFALAGIVLCLMTGLLLLSFTPVVWVLQAFLSLKKEGTKAQQESLAKRYLHGILTILSFECLVAIYFMIVPVANNPMYIVLLAMCIMLFIFYALRNRRTAGNAIRKLSGMMLIVLFVFCTLSFFLPQTIASIQSSVARLDTEIRRNVTGLTDFEQKRETENQRRISAANAEAQQKAQQANRERLAREQAERSQIAESQRAEAAERETQRQIHRAEQAQRQANARTETAKREATKQAKLAREAQEKAKQLALLQQEAQKYQSWTEWRTFTLKAKEKKPINLLQVNPKDSVEIWFAVGERRYRMHDQWYQASWYGSEELPNRTNSSWGLPSSTAPPFSVIMLFTGTNTILSFEKKTGGDASYLFTPERFHATHALQLQVLNNIPANLDIKAKGEMTIQVRIKRYRG